MNRPDSGALTVYGEGALHIVTDTRPVHGMVPGNVGLVVGGPAAVVSLQLAMLGHPPRFVGICGDDPPGAFLTAKLQSHGVDCTELVAIGRTALILAVIRDGHAELTVDAGSFWIDSPWSEEPPSPCEGIAYITGFPDMVNTIQVLGRRGYRLVVDVGFIPLLARPDNLLHHVSSIADFVEVCAVNGANLASSQREELTTLCLDRGVKVVLMTLAADGVVVTTAQQTVHLPAYDVEVVDPLCAGDAFLAGFICATREGLSPVPAAEFGQAVAGTKVGTFARLPDRTECESFMRFHGVPSWE